MKHARARFAIPILVCASLVYVISCAPAARADQVLYDNTTFDTMDTVFYNVGPYSALGDQLTLLSPGIADQAKVELFNAGDAGTFDAELDFYNVGSPVGTLIGSSTLTGEVSAGSDVIDMTFDLGAGVVVPQNVIFAVTISSESPNMDLGVDMFEPPTVGSSDNSFMIAEAMGVFTHLDTNSENVYFQLSGTAEVVVPEGSSPSLLGIGLLIMGIVAWAGKERSRESKRRPRALS